MPKFNLTYNRLHMIQSSLDQLGNMPGAHFGVFVAENVDRIRKRVQLLRDQFKPSEEFMEAMTEVTQENEGISEEEIQAIFEEKHPELHEERQKQVEELLEAAKEETEMNLLTIPIRHLPEELTGVQIAGFVELVSKDD